MKNLEAVLAEYDAMLRKVVPAGDTFTTAEAAAAMGCSQNTATDMVRRLVRAGKVEYAGKEKRVTMVGVAFPVPVYRRTKGKQPPHR